jgi:hypothetical protein
MAIAQRDIVTFPTEFGDIVVTLEYDNVLLRATGIVVVNPSPNSVYVEVIRDSDDRKYSQTFGPGNTRLDIPTGQAARITLVFNERGGLDGYTAGATYPV